MAFTDLKPVLSHNVFCWVAGINVVVALTLGVLGELSLTGPHVTLGVAIVFGAGALFVLALRKTPIVTAEGWAAPPVRPDLALWVCARFHALPRQHG